MGLLSRLRGALVTKRAKPKPAFKPFEHVREDSGTYPDFESALQRYGLLMLIIGKRGSGKTSLGMKFLAWYHHHTDRKCYGVGYSKAKLPRWLKRADALEELPNDSVVLIDEAAILFFSRESMTPMNKLLSKFMAIARHKNLTMILITQSSAMVELNVLRLADVLLFKEPSLLQARFERKSLKDLFERVTKVFKGLDEKPAHFYVYSDEFEGLVRYDLPYFWNDSISRAFREFKG